MLYGDPVVVLQQPSSPAARQPGSPAARQPGSPAARQPGRKGWRVAWSAGGGCA
ncbi:hypothetical protein [Frankia sp. Cppng1_Ct_nod]|uniref:hypothetical protein n=1 Tax=Frankia sp. Cppng1_Ct_nod TaxID=2897162 RepID=UPI0013EF6ED8|nr:hypothetical protein [Frankia sp. Cppng1_Ct_nod]